MKWSPKLEKQLNTSGIQVVRHWPAAADDWNPSWGEGDPFVGYRSDPAQMVLRVTADNAHQAAAAIIQTADLSFNDFEVLPQPDYFRGFS